MFELKVRNIKGQLVRKIKFEGLFKRPSSFIEYSYNDADKQVVIEEKDSYNVVIRTIIKRYTHSVNSKKYFESVYDNISGRFQRSFYYYDELDRVAEIYKEVDGACFLKVNLFNDNGDLNQVHTQSIILESDLEDYFINAMKIKMQEGVFYE